jgi:hypothetical protein
MAVRTTSAAVAKVLEVDATLDMTPFIETANAFVTEICEPVTTYDAARLELIERWLSAHCYAQRDVRRTAEQAKGIGEHFESVIDLGFDNSRFGQMAMRLDTAGGLAALNKQMKKGGTMTAGIEWIGTEPEDIDD